MTEKLHHLSDYSDELAEEICMAISTNPKSIQRLCREFTHWPCAQTIYEWRIRYPSFGDKFAKAKKYQIELLVDETLDIADDGHNDTITRINKDGDEYSICNTEWVNRSRLRIDTRKWLAAKLEPKLYGDKVQVEMPNLNADPKIKEARSIAEKLMSDNHGRDNSTKS